MYLSVGAFACVGKCRSYGAQFAFVSVSPGFCSCLWHSRHPGLCKSVALAGLIARFFCFPRVSYRALPSFHPGLCKSVALAGLIARFFCFPRVSYRALPSFHPGLCKSIVPTALIMRLNFDAVLWCSLNVFGCVNGVLRSFVFLFDCDCMGCGIGGGICGNWGIDCCGLAISPFRGDTPA